MVAAIVLAAGVGACALSEDKIAVNYVPGGDTAPVAGAPAVTLEVKATDERQQYRDRIGTKKNGYGMEMARITATNDVVDLVRGAVESEFKNQGFAIGPGGLAVRVELQNFYNNFKVGLFAGSAVAEVAFALKVRNAAGTLVYSQFYSATGTLDPIMMAGGENARDAVQKALTAAIKKVVDDQALQLALVQAGAPAKPVAKGARQS